MALIAALELRGQRPVTPYNLEAWRQELTAANLLSRFSKIIPGLAEGFVIKFPLITRTQSPPNNSSTITYAEDLNISICKEVTKGRFLGPFPLSLIEQTIGPTNRLHSLSSPKLAARENFGSSKISLSPLTPPENTLIAQSTTPSVQQISQPHGAPSQ